MEIWDGIKTIFSKDKKEETTTFKEADNKVYLKNNRGENVICESCKLPIGVGEKKTFNAKPLHIKCYRKGIKDIRKHYGL
jgi:hypothetical protein